MRKNFKVLILGKGRIGLAIQHYLKKLKVKEVTFFSNEKEIRNFDILIGVLPGEVGEKSLKLALKYKKDLISASDVELEFYLKKKKEIERKKILVIPNCGFCPGLVNLILGQEIANQKEISEIEIKAGSLSIKKFFFPFLWCFEDLILEHQIPSTQIINSKKIKFPPFSGFQRENFFGIEAESYFSSFDFSGIDCSKIKNFTFRIIRPFGFFWFFKYLENQGFFQRRNFLITKKILEEEIEDNLTLAEIKILTKNKKILWQIKSFSKKKEKLNSMQKITGLPLTIIVKFLFRGKIKNKGLLLMEEIGKDQKLFTEILKEIEKERIFLRKIYKR